MNLWLGQLVLPKILYIVSADDRIVLLCFARSVLCRFVEAGGAGSKEEFAANGSEADGENLPESRVGEKCSANAQGIYLSGGLSGKTDSG